MSDMGYHFIVFIAPSIITSYVLSVTVLSRPSSRSRSPSPSLPKSVCYFSVPQYLHHPLSTPPPPLHPFPPSKAATLFSWAYPTLGLSVLAERLPSLTTV